MQDHAIDQREHDKDPKAQAKGVPGIVLVPTSVQGPPKPVTSFVPKMTSARPRNIVKVPIVTRWTEVPLE